MYKILTFVLLSLLISNCIQLTERHFKNSDQTSGGFLDVKLDLNPDKTLRLTRTEQKVVNENEAGTGYEAVTTSTFGTWTESNNRLLCNFKESEDFVKDAFFKSGFKTNGIFQNQNQIILPTSADTIYIYGQPCIRLK